MTGTVCDATTSGVSSSSRRREWIAAAANASASAAPSTKPAAASRDGDQGRAHEEHGVRRQLGQHRGRRREHVRRDAQRAHDQLGAEREGDEQDERDPDGGRAGGPAAARARPASADAPPRGARTCRSCPHACLRSRKRQSPGRHFRLARAPRFRGHSMRRPPSRSPRGTRRHTLWRQVFWLPDRPPAAPSRQRAGSGFSQPSSPVTAAGPRRSCTGFPRVALAGASKRRGC